MKENIFAFACFFGGICLGLSGYAPDVLSLPILPVLLLSILVFLAGIGLGSNKGLSYVIHSFQWQMLLLPIFTIIGTLLFTMLVVFILHEYTLADLMAIGSGFGYYSLSSVLILDMKTMTVGVDEATKLASIALLVNVFREMIAMFGCSFFTHKGGSCAAISVSGINSMDVCLPIILKASGNDGKWLPVSVFHGIALELAVPILISLFCN